MKEIKELQMIGSRCMLHFDRDVHVHKRFLVRGSAERRVFFPEIAEKIRKSVSTVFNKNVGVLTILWIIELKSITKIDIYGKFKAGISSWSNRKFQLKLSNCFNFKLSVPFSLSGAAKNRKFSIPKFRQAARFFGTKNAPLRDSASQNRLCTRYFIYNFVSL
jgi:hypothetical protein